MKSIRNSDRFTSFCWPSLHQTFIISKIYYTEYEKIPNAIIVGNLWKAHTWKEQRCNLKSVEFKLQCNFCAPLLAQIEVFSLLYFTEFQLFYWSDKQFPCRSADIYRVHINGLKWMFFFAMWKETMILVHPYGWLNVAVAFSVGGGGK